MYPEYQKYKTAKDDCHGTRWDCPSVSRRGVNFRADSNEGTFDFVLE